jgi:hypothetical protein
MERKVIETVGAEVDRSCEDMVIAGQELVRISSVTGREGSAQEFGRQQYEAFRLEVRSVVTDRFKVENHPLSMTAASLLRGDGRLSASKKEILIRIQPF